MSQAAARWAERIGRRKENQPEQSVGPNRPDEDAAAAAARQRADLDAGFALFGTLEQPAGAVNAPRRFPKLARRGLHIDARTPVWFTVALDWAVVLTAADAAARWATGLGVGEMDLAAAAPFLLTMLSLKLGLWISDAYKASPAEAAPERGLGGMTLGAFLGLGLANALAASARDAGALSAMLPFAAIAIAAMHASVALWTRAAHRKGAFAETVVLIGATDAAKRFLKNAAKSGEARVVAIVDDRLERAPRKLGGVPVAGRVDMLRAWSGLPNVDRIVIAVSARAEPRVREVLAQLKHAPNRIDLLLDYDVRARHGAHLCGMPLASLAGAPRDIGRALIKRAQDIVFALALLVVFAAPMLLIALAIRLESEGPALYRRRSHGFNNRPITLIKFRTMRHDPEAPLKPSSANAGRITRVGRFLRRRALDELPQLFNVLRGEMSIVGPRPHAIGLKTANRALDDIVAEYAHRHRVRPGITGLAQVSGARGALRTPACVRKRMRFDLDYIERASFWFDLQIMLRTVPIVLGLGARR